MKKARHFSRAIEKLICSFLLVCFCASLQADDIALDAMLQEATFIFEGTVQRVEYRLSDPLGNDPGLPYTFVSYSVERVIKGSYSGAELTLRFLGGPTGEGDEILMLPDYPLFDAGDHDILFVTGNTYFECPLVGCIRGRFRFINELIVNENGQTLMFNADGSLRTHSAIDHDDLINHTMAGKFTIQKAQDSVAHADELPGRGFDRDLGDDSYLDLDVPVAAQNGGVESTDDLVREETFGDFLSARVQTLGLTTVDTQRDSVINADIDRPFLSPANSPAPAPSFAENKREEQLVQTQVLSAVNRQTPSSSLARDEVANSQSQQAVANTHVEKAWIKGVALFAIILTALVALIKLSRKKSG
jgi:hypothetical protein